MMDPRISFGVSHHLRRTGGYTPVCRIEAASAGSAPLMSFRLNSGAGAHRASKTGAIRAARRWLDVCELIALTGEPEQHLFLCRSFNVWGHAIIKALYDYFDRTLNPMP